MGSSFKIFCSPTSIALWDWIRLSVPTLKIRFRISEYFYGRVKGGWVTARPPQATGLGICLLVTLIINKLQRLYNVR
jgi:hypothetical protein